MPLTRLLACSALFAVVLGVVGCGPSEPQKNPVSGSVTWKGHPIKYGTINFRSDGDGRYVATGEIHDGKYEIPEVSGLPAGKYVVSVSYPDPKVPAPKGDEPPGVSLPVREMLPARYNEQSELTADITDESNDVSFELK